MACRYSPQHPEAMSYILPQGGALRRGKPVIPVPSRTEGKRIHGYTQTHNWIFHLWEPSPISFYCCLKENKRKGRKERMAFGWGWTSAVSEEGRPQNPQTAVTLSRLMRLTWVNDSWLFPQRWLTRSPRLQCSYFKIIFHGVLFNQPQQTQRLHKTKVPFFTEEELQLKLSSRDKNPKF